MKLDAGTLVVAALTLVFFALALIEKGLTGEALVEAGVFLVSVKLLLMAYHNRVAAAETKRRLEENAAALARIERRLSGGDPNGR